MYATTIATGLPKTGDAANITGYWSLDGGTPTVYGTANPTELSATNAAGLYWQPLAQSETNGNVIGFAWKSSTAGVAIDPLIVFTSGANIPVAVAGAANGLMIAGSNAATTVNITGNLSGSVGSVTGAVGSVTGAVGSVTAAITLPTIPSNWIAATGIAASALNGKGDWLLSSGYTAPPTVAAIATKVWQDTTAADFTTAGSIGKALFINAAPGAAGGLFIAGSNAATTVNFTGNLSGSVGSVTGAVGSVTGAVGSVTGAVGSVTGAVGSVTGAVASVTAAVTLPTMPTNWVTATGIAASALNGKGDWLLSSGYTAPPTVASIATGVWQDTTAGDFTTLNSIGKALYINAAPGAAGGHFISGSNAATTVNFTGNLSGSVGSVTGSVGSVTGSVGSVTGAVGSVTGAVGSVTGAVASVTAAVTLPTMPTNWVTATGIAASALNGKGDWLLSSGYTAPPSAATIGAAVWDVTLASHLSAGSTGLALNAAGSAGDPWSTSLPGAYGAGTAGKILGSYLDAAITTRSTYAGGAVASVTTPVSIDLTQAVPTTNTAETVGDALNAARADGFGKWKISNGTTLELFASDNLTVVRTFTLDSATSPVNERS